MCYPLAVGLTPRAPASLRFERLFGIARLSNQFVMKDCVEEALRYETPHLLNSGEPSYSHLADLGRHQAERRDQK